MWLSVWFRPCALKTSEGCWDVRVEHGCSELNEENSWYITTGWADFAIDNQLRQSDILTFHFDDSTFWPQIFNVHIYHQSTGCEKPRYANV